MMLAMLNNGGAIMGYRRNQKTIVSLLLIVTLALVGIGSIVFSPPTIAHAVGATIYVSIGKVVAIETHAFHRGVLQVKSNRTGEVYQFYLGNRTVYYPHRYPSIGETVKVHYYTDRGYLKATSVEIQ